MLSKTATPFVASNNHTGQKLFNITEPHSVISPLSIAFAFSLVHLGSAGNTRKQLTDLFESENTLENLLQIYELSNNSIMKMANCFVVNDAFKLKNEYLAMVQKIATIVTRDFSQSVQVAKECNDFIEQGTNNLITNIVKPTMITPDTVSILINTLYFKTIWAKCFKKIKTQEKLFNGKSMVPMMKKRNLIPYFENEQVQVIELVYQDSEYGMVFILPKHVDDIKNCVKYLFHGVNFKHYHVDCEIPKFTQQKQMNLKPLLQKMGVTDLFSSDANLSNMSDDRLYVSEAIHEAVVIVDESGTEGTDVTVIDCFSAACCETEVKIYMEFYAHHSFIYGIRHRSANTILFAGDYRGDT